MKTETHRPGSRVASPFRGHSVVCPVGIALLLIAPSALAQPAVEVTIGRTLDSTSGGVSDTSTRGATTGGLLLEHSMADERLRVYCDLDAGDYSTPGDWSYVLSRAGATWRADIGQTGTRGFSRAAT